MLQLPNLTLCSTDVSACEHLSVFLPNFFCACAEAAISKVRTKVHMLPLDLVTTGPDFI